MSNKILSRLSRKVSLVSVSCTAVAVTVLALWPAWSSDARSTAAPPGDVVGGASSSNPISNPVFGHLIAGTYAEVGPGYSFTMNIRADGTLEWFASWFFGDGTGAYYNGPVLGSWKRTGPLEITTIELGYLFNGDGSFFATGRVNEVFTFSPNLQVITYSGVEDLFAPDQDPTNPDAEPFDSFGFAGGPINRLNHMN